MSASVFAELYSLSVCDTVRQCLCGLAQFERVRKFPYICDTVVAILAGVLAMIVARPAQVLASGGGGVRPT